MRYPFSVNALSVVWEKVEGPMQHTLEPHSQLTDQIDYWHRRWALGQRAWSLAHHGALFGASVLSVGVGFIVQLKSELLTALPNQSLSTFLAFLAAALSAVAGGGGFERKWRANRISRARLDGLRLDLSEPGADLGQMRKQLKEIIRLHDEEVLGIAGK